MIKNRPEALSYEELEREWYNLLKECAAMREDLYVSDTVGSYFTQMLIMENINTYNQIFDKCSKGMDTDVAVDFKDYFRTHVVRFILSLKFYIFSEYNLYVPFPEIEIYPVSISGTNAGLEIIWDEKIYNVHYRCVVFFNYQKDEDSRDVLFSLKDLKNDIIDKKERFVLLNNDMGKFFNGFVSYMYPILQSINYNEVDAFIYMEGGKE